MRQLKLIGTFVFFLFLTFPVMAQVKIFNDSVKVMMKSAKKYQYGINRDVNSMKAARIYHYLVKRGSGDAMRELGKMFEKGEGVKQSYKAAYNLYCKAIRAGNNLSLCNLAYLYQKGYGVEQSYTKAFVLYAKAAKLNIPQGYYGAGYLQYKGFGVEQDYEKAIEYFKKGAGKNHSGCNYMLANYNMKGYNGKQDIAAAKSYLDKAMKNGHGWTLDITKNNVLQNSRNNYGRAKNKMFKERQKIYTNNPSANTLSGKWEGTAYFYDWSRKQILNEEEISLSITANDDETISIIVEKQDSMITTCSFQKSGHIWEIKEPNMDANWFIYKTQFNLGVNKDEEILHADFLRVSNKTQEPLKPTMAVLHKAKENYVKETPFAITQVYPNPFSDKITIAFNINIAQPISFVIYDITGNMLYQNPSQKFDKGNHTIELNAKQFKKGDYILQMRGQNYSVSENIKCKF